MFQPGMINSYVMLGHLLAPGRRQEQLEQIFEKYQIDWRSLLLQANLHLCTPLWFVRMRDAEFLSFLPSDLLDYLQQLYMANKERNEAFRHALSAFLISLKESSIPIILLKGAATFCDDLFEDPGARLMGDIDILVKPHHADVVLSILNQQGYRECTVAEEQDFAFAPDFQSHHHLPRRCLSGSPVELEIHIRVDRGQAGRVLTAETAWNENEVAEIDGIPVKVLTPTYRLLHNTLHALLPRREFIRSNISLQQLAEFSFIVRRYADRIDWKEWYARGSGQGLAVEFSTYLTLAERLMGLPYPHVVPRHRMAERHARRIASVGALLPVICDINRNKIGWIRGKYFIALNWVYYQLARPLWIWRNPCYASGRRNLPRRIIYLGSYIYAVGREKLSRLCRQIDDHHLGKQGL